MDDVRLATRFFSLVAPASRPVLRGPFRLRATGLDLLPAGGGFVLAENHVSSAVRGRAAREATERLMDEIARLERELAEA